MLRAMLEWQLANVRVLLVNVPRLLGDVMSGIMAGDPEIKIVSEVSGKDMLGAIAGLDPNLVVFGGESDETEIYVALMGARYPMLRAVTVDADGRAATIYEPGSAARRVTDISPRMMLSLIRGPAG